LAIFMCMGIDARNWARTKSAGSHSQLWLWQEWIERLLALRLKDTAVEQLVRATANHEQLKYVTLLLEWELRDSRTSADAVCTELLSAVNDSDYSLCSWLEATAAFGTWLANQHRRAGLCTVIGYIACSIEAAQARADSPSLRQTVTEMLDQYGFEGH